VRHDLLAPAPSARDASLSRTAGVCAIVPARGGSKGVPRKNLRTVGGVPLVARAVHTLLSSATIGAVVVSTDDPQIAAVASRAGALVVERPLDLAGDAASSESALEHALAYLAAQDVVPDVTVFLQATSPFVRAADIDRAVTLVRSGACDVAFSTCGATVTTGRRG
jgi:CMP-N-acetylneuraminic acid synthetase